MKDYFIDIHTHAFMEDGEDELAKGSGLLGTNIKKIKYQNEIHEQQIQGLSDTESSLVNQVLDTAEMNLVHGVVLLALDEMGLKYPTKRTFEIAQSYPAIIPSIAVHPETAGAQKKLEKQIDEWQLKFGDKWYRPVISYDLLCDPRKVKDAYWDAISEAGATVVAHTGPVNSAEGVASKRNKETNPYFWIPILEKYGDSRKFNLVLSHCGTPSRKFRSYVDEALEVAANDNVWVDHSGLLYHDGNENYFEISRPAFEKTMKFIKNGLLDQKSVVCGSDYPVVTNIEDSWLEQVSAFRRYGAQDDFAPFKNTYRALLRS